MYFDFDTNLVWSRAKFYTINKIYISSIPLTVSMHPQEF